MYHDYAQPLNNRYFVFNGHVFRSGFQQRVQQGLLWKMCTRQDFIEITVPKEPALQGATFLVCTVVNGRPHYSELERHVHVLFMLRFQCSSWYTRHVRFVGTYMHHPPLRKVRILDVLTPIMGLYTTGADYVRGSRKLNRSLGHVETGRTGALYCTVYPWQNMMNCNGNHVNVTSPKKWWSFPFLCCMSDYRRVLNKQYMNICIYVVGAEDQIEWQSGTPLRTQHWWHGFLWKEIKQTKETKAFCGIFPFKLQFLQKKLPPFQYRKAWWFFLGSKYFGDTHTHIIWYIVKVSKVFISLFPWQWWQVSISFPGLWVNDFNGEKLHHQGLAFLFAWSPQGARNNKKIYWMRYFFDFFFRTSRTLVFGAMSFCSKILENISDTSGFPNLTFNKCRLHFEDWSILCFHQNPG